jgi:hypothetical protein
MDAVRLRLQDIAHQMKQRTVRAGEGDKDQLPPFPATLTPLRQNHLGGVRALHQQDVTQGHGEGYLPRALDRQYPGAPKARGWQ